MIAVNADCWNKMSRAERFDKENGVERWSRLGDAAALIPTSAEPAHAHFGALIADRLHRA